MHLTTDGNTVRGTGEISERHHVGSIQSPLRNAPPEHLSHEPLSPVSNVPASSAHIVSKVHGRESTRYGLDHHEATSGQRQSSTSTPATSRGNDRSAETNRAASDTGTVRIESSPITRQNRPPTPTQSGMPLIKSSDFLLSDISLQQHLPTRLGQIRYPPINQVPKKQSRRRRAGLLGLWRR